MKPWILEIPHRKTFKAKPPEKIYPILIDFVDNDVSIIFGDIG